MITPPPRGGKWKKTEKKSGSRKCFWVPGGEILIPAKTMHLLFGLLLYLVLMYVHTSARTRAMAGTYACVWCMLHPPVVALGHRACPRCFCEARLCDDRVTPTSHAPFFSVFASGNPRSPRASFRYKGSPYIICTYSKVQINTIITINTDCVTKKVVCPTCC